MDFPSRSLIEHLLGYHLSARWHRQMGRHCGLLCARNERPCCRTSDKHHELASLHEPTPSSGHGILATKPTTLNRHKSIAIPAAAKNGSVGSCS
jgi:hypothetical protein